MANTSLPPNSTLPPVQLTPPGAVSLPPHEQEEENFMHLLLGYYNTYVRQYFWLYPTAVLLFIAAAFIYLRTQVPLYRSTCQLHVSNADLRVTEFRGIVDPNNMAGASFINTQIRLMQSPEILNRAYELTGGLDGDSSKCSRPQISQIPNTTLVDLSITSPYPEAAAKMANTIAE
ncbi:MAG: Wzz/FepE/Etk N-terminal domain-containing protein, partial [Lentisphaeria bacterium]|nr:Wzz/FepE/Etk N-terminal domain-containing protein [Lentisphaeria bacterium]